MAAHSSQILHRPHRWHVQQAGAGDTVLLIHGAGGTTQSWRSLFPLLAQDHHVVAMDLPGQGFSQSGAKRRLGLDHMAQDLLSLIRAKGWQPSCVIGHSAGAAIALALWRQGLRPAQGIVGINAALAPFTGVAGVLFPAVAKALSLTPLSAHFFSANATPASVARLIAGTGSHLDDQGHDFYLRLIRDSAHVDATLSMMAQWDLSDLRAHFSSVETPVHLIVGAQDKTVPPSTSRDAAQALPQARVTTLSGLGHLAHEEDATRVLSAINA